MLQLTTGLIDNTPAPEIDMTPTCVFALKSLSSFNRPCVSLGVKVSNSDNVAVNVEIKGYYMFGTTKKEYITDGFYIDAGNVVLRQYEVQFDAFEFWFFLSSRSVSVSAWAINAYGRTTISYSVSEAELDGCDRPTRKIESSGVTGQNGIKTTTSSEETKGVKSTEAKISIGATGETGETGETGVKGALRALEGLAAPIGMAREIGSTGVTGSIGTTGVSGPTGAQVKPGATGAMGATGTLGASGTSGESDATGVTGATGAKGITGARGESGTTGTTGVTGTRGKQGAKGTTGSLGAKGAQGVTGPTGATGPTGPGFSPIAPSSSRMVYVNKGGNDTSGDGTINNPFITILKALTSIDDASPNKRYSVLVGPGTYNESFSLKANVIIIGVDPILVRIGSEKSSIDINDPTWLVSGDNLSGFRKVTFVAPTLTFDFNYKSGVKGELYFDDVRLVTRNANYAN